MDSLQVEDENPPHREEENSDYASADEKAVNNDHLDLGDKKIEQNCENDVHGNSAVGEPHSTPKTMNGSDISGDESSSSGSSHTTHSSEKFRSQKKARQTKQEKGKKKTRRSPKHDLCNTDEESNSSSHSGKKKSSSKKRAKKDKGRNKGAKKDDEFFDLITKIQKNSPQKIEKPVQIIVYNEHTVKVIYLESGELGIIATDRKDPEHPAYNRAITEAFKSEKGIALMKALGVDLQIKKRHPTDPHQQWSSLKTPALGNPYLLYWQMWVRFPDPGTRFDLKDVEEWGIKMTKFFNAADKADFVKSQSTTTPRRGRPNEYRYGGLFNGGPVHASTLFTVVEIMNLIIKPRTNLTENEILNEKIIMKTYFGRDADDAIRFLKNLNLPASAAKPAEPKDEYDELLALFSESK